METLEDVQKTAEVAGTVAAAGALVGAGGAAGPALRLVVAGAPCKVNHNTKTRSYPIALHPTQWQVMESDAAGMVAGNFMITSAFWLLMSIAVRIIGATNIVKSLDTLGLCRFPSAPLMVFQFLLQGTSLGSMVLVFYPPSAGLFLIGLAALLFCLAVPCVLAWKISKDVPDKAFYMIDERVERRGFLKFIIGPGEWVSVSEREHWVCRYASCLRSFRQEWAIYSFAEMTSSLVIAAIQASNAENLIGCGHQKLFAGLVFLFLLISEVVLWPRSRVRDCYIMAAALLAQISAMFLMALGYYNENILHWGFDVAGALLMVAVALLLLKTLLDLISEAYVFCTGRRARLQGVAFESKPRVLTQFDHDDLMSNPSEDNLIAVEESGVTASDSIALVSGNALRADSSRMLRGLSSSPQHNSPQQSPQHNSLSASVRSSAGLSQRGMRTMNASSLTAKNGQTPSGLLPAPPTRKIRQTDSDVASTISSDDRSGSGAPIADNSLHRLPSSTRRSYAESGEKTEELHASFI